MRKRVLVLDDDAFTGRSVARALLQDFDVDLFLQGDIALKAVLDRNYDCIVSDVDMADMDGPEFYARVVELRPEMRDHFMFHTGTLQETSPDVPRIDKRDSDVEQLRTMVRSLAT